MRNIDVFKLIASRIDLSTNEKINAKRRYCDAVELKILLKFTAHSCLESISDSVKNDNKILLKLFLKVAIHFNHLL